MNQTEKDALELLEIHHDAFFRARPLADRMKHPVPSDTAAWSQILVSLLTGIPGLARKKGQDLADGSDVKGANAWEAIDRPRFNGVLPAGRVSKKARRPDAVTALDDVPFIFFVLWDVEPKTRNPRCRVWCVRAASDKAFRAVAAEWYRQRARRRISSNNFQLHPPIDADDDVVRNRCGNLTLPLLFCAVREQGAFRPWRHDPSVLKSGRCVRAPA